MLEKMEINFWNLRVQGGARDIQVAQVVIGEDGYGLDEVFVNGEGPTKEEAAMDAYKRAQTRLGMLENLLKKKGFWKEG
jgi:hypothetical protein